MSLEGGREGGTEGGELGREGREVGGGREGRMEGGRGGRLGEGGREGRMEGGMEGGREGGRDEYYTYSNRCVHIHSMHFIVGPMPSEIGTRISLTMYLLISCIFIQVHHYHFIS